MLGGVGDDFIYGQSDDDQITGGAGADTFQFATLHGDDVITDFTVNEDIFLAFGFGFASGADVSTKRSLRAQPTSRRRRMRGG